MFSVYTTAFCWVLTYLRKSEYFLCASFSSCNLAPGVRNTCLLHQTWCQANPVTSAPLSAPCVSSGFSLSLSLRNPCFHSQPRKSLGNRLLLSNLSADLHALEKKEKRKTGKVKQKGSTTCTYVFSRGCRFLGFVEPDARAQMFCLH